MGAFTDTVPGAFICKLLGDYLQCNKEQSQEETSIAINDIVCILPSSMERQETTYSVLYLERHGGSSDANTVDDRVRLVRISTGSLPSTLLSQYLYKELPRHLSSLSRIHVVISTGSGAGKAKSLYQDVLQPFLSYLGLTTCEVHETQSSQTITELAHSKFIPCAQTGIDQTIILLSGDGGLVDIVDAFYNSSESMIVPPCIGLMPTGTGNAMANSIGLHCPIMGLMTLLRGKPRRIPVFAASFSPRSQYITEEGRGRAPICSDQTVETEDHKVYGAVVASWGIHAALVADSDTLAYRKFGVDRFKLAAKELLCPSDGSPTHSYHAIITLAKKSKGADNQQMEAMDQNEHMYVLATLVSRLEKGFVISPDTSPLDGCLRFVHFGPTPPDVAMQLMSKAYQGGLHVHEKAVTYKEIEGFRIDFREEDERWRRVCIDGKIIAVERGGWMEVRREPRCLLNLIADFP
ncbi:hypothetical protein SI65_07521 [Aspergillus cristatus]|uniref:DAGKc domain-containing protein n=1 Tax=Aspergillus cristatus TaxID=573508 RepID=A0A1E3B830_ASPCR|nr:hypothetical protein SI65_07521 [Aspergillus cristatus]